MSLKQESEKLKSSHQSLMGTFYLIVEKGNVLVACKTHQLF